VNRRVALLAQERSLNRSDKKQISGFGLPPIAVTKIKYKSNYDK